MRPSYTARADNPERLAEHAIGLLEQRLKAEHGLRLRMGVELEFYLRMDRDGPALQGPLANEDDPLQLGKRHHQTNPMPLSRFVAYGYRESGDNNLFHDGGPLLTQYELVTNHAHPVALRNLPRAIDSLRQELTQGQESFDKPSTGRAMADRAQAARSRLRDWMADNSADIRFDTQPGILPPSGMHLNVCLQDATTGEAMLSSYDKRVSSLIRATKDWFQQEHALLTPEKGQQQRWQRRLQNGSPQVEMRISSSKNKFGQLSYIENKAPGADCNPHYAILLQMAAACDALDQEKGHAGEPSLTAMLEHLEPGLGKRFSAAVAAHPELGSYHYYDQPAQGRG